MSDKRVEEFVRHFPENGMKLLLQHPLNVRDLLRIAGSDLVDRIDFDSLQLDATTYVQRDYRHVESDVVLRGTMKGEDSRRKRRPALLIYILIEHQTDPDPLMAFRVLEYVVQIYRGQLREWGQRHATLTGFRFHLVLPIVFYTGLRSWPALGDMGSLLTTEDTFNLLVPRLEPLFVNLGETPSFNLEKEGGAFGQILRCTQQRRASEMEFQALLDVVVQALEQMPKEEQLRWKDLLSYLHGLVYHDRDEFEIPKLQSRIEHSVRSNDHQREIDVMGRTGAEALMDKGELRGKRNILVKLLRLRFKKLPKEMRSRIEACADSDQLDQWLERFATATTLEEVGILPPS